MSELPTSAHRAEAQRRRLHQLTRMSRYQRDRSNQDPALACLAYVLSMIPAVPLREVASHTGLAPEVVAQALQVLVDDGFIGGWSQETGRADLLVPWLLSEHFDLPAAYVLSYETRATPSAPGGGIASMPEYDERPKS